MGASGRCRSFYQRLVLGLIAAAVLGVAASAAGPQNAATLPGGQSAVRCRLDGRVTSGNVPLPGVSMLVHAGNTLKAATSTDLDGRFSVNFGSGGGASYQVSAELTGFARGERELR